MTSHTPGPWRIHATAPDRIVVNGSCVYRVRDMTTNEDGQYGRPNPDDMRLMAAAPELLAALYWVDDWLFANTPANDEVHTVVAKAIAKAEGRTE